MRAVADHLAGGVASLANQLTNYAKACVKPSHDYFEKKFSNDLKEAVSAFKFARYLNESNKSSGYCSQQFVILTTSLFFLS